MRVSEQACAHGGSEGRKAVFPNCYAYMELVLGIVGI